MSNVSRTFATSHDIEGRFKSPSSHNRTAEILVVSAVFHWAVTKPVTELAGRPRAGWDASRGAGVPLGTVSDPSDVPPVSERDLHDLLLRAWGKALARPVPVDARGGSAAARSKHFVGALGDALAAHHEKFPDVRVFCRGRPQEMFPRREEFLFDVLVARMDTVTSPVHKASLPYICESLFQVESEFAFDTRETVLDASKLVCGAARQSLVVAPATSRPDNYLAPLAAIAPHVRGEMFVAFVSHPDRWGEETPAPVLLQWVTTGWRRTRP